ncbi:MAG: hypothetical protein OXU20_25025 [Myxococcales bacterium]|nr:hypothetical protein [Myxococcales bacterium]MDD9972156.1 hypothetical protein [Myxococcales bacterium]
MKIKVFRYLAFAMAATGLVFSGAIAPAPAEAGRLKAKVFLTQAKIPKKTTEKGLVAFARRNRARLLRETTDKELKKRKWKGHLVIQFNKPVGDLEFQVLFYDIHDGPRRFVQDMSTFVNDRSQKTFVQRVSLPRPDFKPNRNMELVVTVRRQEVARMKFGLIGEEKKRSGVVNF